MCDDWLAVDQSDGSIERVLQVSSDGEIANFRRIFSSSTKRDFSDGHLWFSRKFFDQKEFSLDFLKRRIIKLLIF